MSTEEAVSRLLQAGAKLEKREDSHGVTRSGWWMDDIWLGPAKNPKQALSSLYG